MCVSAAVVLAHAAVANAFAPSCTVSLSLAGSAPRWRREAHLRVPACSAERTSVCREVVIPGTAPEFVWRYVASPSTWSSWLPSSLRAYPAAGGARGVPLVSGQQLVEEFGVGLRLGAVTWDVDASGRTAEWTDTGDFELVMSSEGLPGSFNQVGLRILCSPAPAIEGSVLRVVLSWESANEALGLLSTWLLQPASLLDLSIGLWLLQARLRCRSAGDDVAPALLSQAGEGAGEGTGEAVGVHTPDLRRVLTRDAARTTYDLLAATIYGGAFSDSESVYGGPATEELLRLAKADLALAESVYIYLCISIYIMLYVHICI